LTAKDAIRVEEKIESCEKKVNDLINKKERESEQITVWFCE